MNRRGIVINSLCVGSAEVNAVVGRCFQQYIRYALSYVCWIHYDFILK
jgi:hypothetical protein